MSSQQGTRVLSKAMQYRHTRSHRLNDHSSRSHCVVTLEFHSKERDQFVQPNQG